MGGGGVRRPVSRIIAHVPEGTKEIQEKKKSQCNKLPSRYVNLIPIDTKHEG
jgi:hypothetical protein